MSNPWQDIAKPSLDFNVLRISETHPLSLFWGRNTQGKYLFIYEMAAELAPQRKLLPRLAGIEAWIRQQGSKAMLVLVLNETVNWELFLSLCSNLIRATSGLDASDNAVGVFLRRLTRWQEFLKRKRPGILPPEAIKGLIGELLLLEQELVPAFGWEVAVASWRGPENAPQDFAIHETAVEVKCQSGGSKPSVRITSVEQLMPQLPEGYLVVYTISSAASEEADGFSLNELVERIRDEIQLAPEPTRDRFEELLFLADYTMREEYDECRYKRVSTKCFYLGDGFPRIEVSSIPAAVDHVSYSLRLEPCEPFRATPSWWGRKS